MVGGLQENHTVVSLNPFAILGQEDEPQSHCKEVSNLSLVVSTPVNGQSSSPQYLSKSTKNKKRKLAKRSPVSGGSSPLFLRDSKPPIIVYMSDTFFWNVRGINDLSKHRPLSSWIHKRRICFGVFLEMHVNEASNMSILSVLGPEWKLIANYQYSDLSKV